MAKLAFVLLALSVAVPVVGTDASAAPERKLRACDSYCQRFPSATPRQLKNARAFDNGGEYYERLQRPSCRKSVVVLFERTGTGWQPPLLGRELIKREAPASSYVCRASQPEPSQRCLVTSAELPIADGNRCSAEVVCLVSRVRAPSARIVGSLMPGPRGANSQESPLLELEQLYNIARRIFQ